MGSHGWQMECHEVDNLQNLLVSASCLTTHPAVPKSVLHALNRNRHLRLAAILPWPAPCRGVASRERSLERSTRVSLWTIGLAELVLATDSTSAALALLDDVDALVSGTDDVRLGGMPNCAD